MLDETEIAPYLVEHIRRTARTAEPDDGYLCLAVAENRLMWDILAEKADAVRNVPVSAFTYDDMRSSPPFQRAIARTLSDRLIGLPVDPNHIVTMAGAGSIVEALAWALVDPGESVVVPTPSYSGYWNDLQSRIGVRIAPAHTTIDDDFRLTEPVLDRAASTTDEVRALLLTNPANPLGRCLTEAEIATAVGWARRRRIPIIANEIYGLSIHRPGRFTSIVDVAGGFADDLHHVWAMSKDLAASGLRAGVATVSNDDVRRVMVEHLYFSAVSGDTKHLATTMLGDEVWFDRYLGAMRSRLADAYAATAAVLDDHGIAVVEADAGFFLYADVRPHLREPTWEAENRLWRAVLDRTGVNLTPGSACRSSEPGFLRICYAAAPMVDAIRGVTAAARVITDPSGGA